MGAVSSQQFGDGLADALRRARDQRALSNQIQFHTPEGRHGTGLGVHEKTTMS